MSSPTTIKEMADTLQKEQKLSDEQRLKVKMALEWAYRMGLDHAYHDGYEDGRHDGISEGRSLERYNR